MDPAQFVDTSGAPGPPQPTPPVGTPVAALPGVTLQHIITQSPAGVDTTPPVTMRSPLVMATPGTSELRQEATALPTSPLQIPPQRPGLPAPVASPGVSTPPTPRSPLTHVLPYSPRRTAQSTQKRRSSTRSIKRKKFDDEVVESSLQIKQAERTPRLRDLSAAGSLSLPGLGGVVLPSPEILPSPAALAAPPPPPPAPLLPQPPPPPPPAATPILTVATPQPPPEKKPRERKPSKSRSKKTGKASRGSVAQLPPAAASTKDLGRWKPQDDLALITNVQQTQDLTAVHLGVKFSCKFTLREVQERWYALLYDPVLSKLAVQAIKQLHPDVIASVQAKTLFSREEETLLGKVASTSQPTQEVFEEILQKNPSLFFPARNAKVLHSHWLLMKQYHLLPDQSVQPMPRGDHVLNFSDAEDIINDEELREPRDESLEHELSVADRRQKREIRHLEAELPKWQVLVDTIMGVSPPDFDNQTLAVLRGRLVRYLMRSREITLGRATRDNPIDVDLALEGPAWKISRRQGVIKLRNSGDFVIANEGRRPIYIDGKPVLSGNKHKLNNNSVVEISCLRFIFLINQDLISVFRVDGQKTNT